MKRDLRVDFFRGLALIIILINHIELTISNRLLSFLTLRPLGYSDMAQVFVLLSGYSYGLVYQKKIIKEGHRQVAMKLLTRPLTIYSCYSIMAMSILVIFLAPFAEYENNPFLGHGMDSLIDQPVAYISEILSLTNFPERLMVLPLYVILLASAPVLLLVYKRNRLLAIALSASIYLYSQVYHLSVLYDFKYIYIPFSKHSFNPLAWQFLFFIAITLGVKKASNQKIKFGVLPKILSITFLIIVFLTFKIVKPLLYRGYIDLEPVWLTVPFDKSFLTPLVLIHVLCLWLLFVLISPKSEVYEKSAMAKPFIVCGQNSIYVYCLGVILVFSSKYLYHEIDGGRVLMVTLEGIAVALSLSFIPLKNALLHQNRTWKRNFSLLKS